MNLVERLRRYTEPKAWETASHPMNGWIGREGVQGLMNEAANRIDELETLLSGTRCATCGGSGVTWHDLAGCEVTCSNTRCIDGRVPGVIEQLESIILTLDELMDGRTFTVGRLAHIRSALRRAVSCGEDGGCASMPGCDCPHVRRAVES